MQLGPLKNGILDWPTHETPGRCCKQHFPVICLIALLISHRNEHRAGRDCRALPQHSIRFYLSSR
jgi:hypothetical protein